MSKVSKKKFNPLTLILIVIIVILLNFILSLDWEDLRETDEERNIRGAKEWLEEHYEVIYFEGDIGGPINMPLVRMKEKGDRATQVTTGFDAITRAYPKGDIYTVTIDRIVGSNCIYGLTSEEWKLVEDTTYGKVLDVSLVECNN